MPIVDRDALNGGAAAIPVTFAGGGRGHIPTVALVGADGRELVEREVVPLAMNVSAAGAQPAATLYGGDYHVRVFAAAWNGGSAKLQFLDADGATWSDVTTPAGAAVAPLTANGSIYSGMGSDARVRLVVTGTPTGLYATASRMP